MSVLKKKLNDSNLYLFIYIFKELFYAVLVETPARFSSQSG